MDSSVGRIVMASLAALPINLFILFMLSAKDQTFPSARFESVAIDLVRMPAKASRSKVAQKTLRQSIKPKPIPLREIAVAKPVAVADKIIKEIIESEIESTQEILLGEDREEGLPSLYAKIGQLDNSAFFTMDLKKPRYPGFCINYNIEGQVSVLLTVGKDGTVLNYRLLEAKGHPHFGRETMKVMPQWRFPPPMVRGRRIAVRDTHWVFFKLEYDDEEYY